MATTGTTTAKWYRIGYLDAMSEIMSKLEYDGLEAALTYIMDNSADSSGHSATVNSARRVMASLHTISVIADEQKICACCAIKVANDDESGCLDYYHHTPHAMRNPTFVGNYVIAGEREESFTAFTCAGCGQSEVFGEYYLASVLSN